jgi:hypothetical protein
MKLLGGSWSRGDFFALLGVITAILAIPGMPKLLHWNSDLSSKHADTPGATTVPKTVAPAPKAVQKTRKVSSGQVNVGCDHTQKVQTPMVSFGKNPEISNRGPSGLTRTM